MIVLIIIALLFLTSCTYLKEKKDVYFGNQSETNITETEYTCPECVCGAELDAAIYYFDEDIETGLKTFLSEANNFVFCAFVRLDTPTFNNLFSITNEDSTVRILFDEASTMDCSNVCIPFQRSQYNYFLAEGIDIGVVQDLHENFCVSEDGLFITSAALDRQIRSDYGLFINSDGLRDIFIREFEDLWGEKR